MRQVTIEIPDVPEASPRESWCRLPPEGGTCPESGMKRTFLLNLIREKKIRAKYGGSAAHGFYLIERNSLNAYILSLPDGPPEAAPEKRERMRALGSLKRKRE